MVGETIDAQAADGDAGTIQADTVVKREILAAQLNQNHRVSSVADRVRVRARLRVAVDERVRSYRRQE